MMQPRTALLFLGLASKAQAYNNNAPFSRLPTLGWSSWVSLGPGADHPVFDFCVRQPPLPSLPPNPTPTNRVPTGRRRFWRRLSQRGSTSNLQCDWDGL